MILASNSFHINSAAFDCAWWLAICKDNHTIFNVFYCQVDVCFVQWAECLLCLFAMNFGCTLQCLCHFLMQML